MHTISCSREKRPVPEFHSQVTLVSLPSPIACCSTHTDIRAFPVTYPNYLDFCARGWWLFSLTCNNSHHCVKLPKRWKTACCTFSPFDKEAWDIIAMEYQTQIYFCLFNWLWVACMHIYSYLCGSGFVFVCICPYAVRFSYLWRKWPWKLVQLVYASWIANREEWLLI